MSTPLDVSTRQRADGSWIVTVAGEIDMSNAGAFQESLAQARAKAEEGEGWLVVDLQEVEYLDSAGLTTLFANAPGIELIASPLLAPVLAISGLADLVTVHGLAGGPDGAQPGPDGG
jgi:anti-sigma B factor antagonist